MVITLKRISLGLTLIVASLLALTLVKNVFGIGDTTPPLTTHKLAGTLGSNGWYTSSVKLSLWSDDLESGVKKTEYWVDSNPHSTSSYSTFTNLVVNPSFESSDGGAGALGWIKVTGSGATLTRSSEANKFGTYSGKIVSFSSGWSSFDTVAPGLNLNAGTTYTVTGWVKRTSVSGNGAKIRILLASGGSIVAQSTASLTATADWERVSTSFTAETSTGYLVEVGLDGTGTVWWDGINLYQGSSPTEVNFTVSSEGTHEAHYFSTNNDGVKENTKDTEQFKIDTVGPENWRDFTLEQSGNSHTFKVSIKVDDKTSGIDVDSAYFQYKVAEASGFGYYSNLTNCQSNWVSGGWLKVADILTTPAIDFCDSSWGEGESIKFKIKDRAGNEVIKERALLAAWLETQNGNVHSNGGIDFSTTGAKANAQYIVSSRTSPVNNFTSEKNWLVAPYKTISNLNYQYFFNMAANPSTLPLGRLPITSGFYINASDCSQNNRDFTIDSNVIPSGYETIQNLAAVILVCGDLTIKNNFNLHPTSALVFAVKGKTKISKKVETMAGFYIADGEINSSYDGNDGNGLTIYGGLSSNSGFDFKTRSLKEKLNLTNPSERIIMSPFYFVSKALLDLLVSVGYSWQEVAP